MVHYARVQISPVPITGLNYHEITDIFIKVQILHNYLEDIDLGLRIKIHVPKRTDARFLSHLNCLTPRCGNKQ